MEDQLWDLFRETGEPMGYLLYRAEQAQKNDPMHTGKQTGTQPAPSGQVDGAPTASA